DLAWPPEPARDFERAGDLPAHGVEQADGMDLTFGQVFGRIVLGAAHLGLGARERAFRLFDEVARRMERERVLMGWILRMPLHLGRAWCWLARRRPVEARREAERLCEVAGQPGERTYLALGFLTLAECAAAERQPGRALAHLERARATGGTDDTPLVAWRIETTAARLAAAGGDEDLAKECRQRAIGMLTRLATTVRDVPRLYHALSTACVRGERNGT